MAHMQRTDGERREKERQKEERLFASDNGGTYGEAWRSNRGKNRVVGAGSHEGARTRHAYLTVKMQIRTATPSRGLLPMLGASRLYVAGATTTPFTSSAPKLD